MKTDVTDKELAFEVEKLEKRVSELKTSLQDSENKYMSIFEHSGNAMLFIKEDMTICLVNKELEIITGYNKEELEGKKKWTEFITNKEDLAKMIKYHELRRSNHESVPSSYEFQFTDKYGKKRDVMATVSMIPGTKQSMAALVDITSRKKFERELKESEQKFREVFNNANDALFLLKITENGYNEKFMEVNDVACYILGYTKEELLNMSPLDIDSSDTIKVAAEWDNIIKAGHATFETTHNTKDGLKIPVEINARVFDINGEKSLLAIARDISERKNAELALKASEERYRLLVETAAEGIVLLNWKGNVIDANQNVLEMAGLKREEVVGKNIVELLPKVKISAKDVILDFKNILKNKPMDQMEWTLINSRGEEVNFIPHYSNIKEGERNIGISVILEDITQRKKMENELKQSIKEKEMLLKEIHHRVKNNLQVISSLLSLQSRYIHDEEALDIFKESQSRARSMAIIHEKLYQSSDQKSVHFGEYINTLTLELFRTYEVDPGLVKLNTNVEDIKLDISAAIPLGLIVNELVSNSMKHAFPSGQKGEINIDFHKTDGFYLLEVSDDGVGFPDDLDFKMTKSLGLQLVTSLVDQIDAKIKLDKTKGTSFIIKFKEIELIN